MYMEEACYLLADLYRLAEKEKGESFDSPFFFIHNRLRV